MTMKTTSSVPTGPALLPDVSFQNVTEAVAALSSPQLHRLAIIAGRRLDRLAALPTGQRLRSLHEPGDFVSEAIRLLLVAVETPGKGRRVKPKHLRDAAAFFNFLQAVVQSCISNALKSVIRQGEHVSLEALDNKPTGNKALDPGHVIDLVAQAQTMQGLFATLRERSHDNPNMLASVALWESDFRDLDRIPKGTLDDKGVFAIRTQAKQILQSMAARDGIPEPTGREVL